MYKRMYINALHTLGAAGLVPPRSTSIQILLTCIYRASLRNIVVRFYAGERANEAELYIIHWLAKFSALSPYSSVPVAHAHAIACGAGRAPPPRAAPSS